MADKNTGREDVGEQSTPKTSFEQAAERGDIQDSLLVTDTARAQIDNQEEWERQLDIHQDAWMIERNKIGDNALPMPTYELEAQQSRDLLQEYRERQANWAYQFEVIDAHYSGREQSIRSQGQTLMDAFNQMPLAHEPSAEIAYTPPEHGAAMDGTSEAIAHGVTEDFNQSADLNAAPEIDHGALVQNHANGLTNRR